MSAILCGFCQSLVTHRRIKTIDFYLCRNCEMIHFPRHSLRRLQSERFRRASDRSRLDQMYDQLCSNSGLPSDNFNLLQKLIAEAQRPSMVEEFIRGVSGLVDEFETDAFRDPMTKLYTRRYFDAQIVAELMRAEIGQTDLAVLFVDMDGLKTINDTYHSHSDGDRALIELGGVLSAAGRDDDHVCRTGGDEFAIISPETSACQGMVFAKRIIDSLQTKNIQVNATIDGQLQTIGFPLRVSIGISSYPEDFLGTISEGMSHRRMAALLCKLADKALYQAKVQGRNRFEVVANIPPVAYDECVSEVRELAGVNE